MSDNVSKSSISLVNPIYPINFFAVNEKFTSPKHWHKEIEMAYVISGDVNINVNATRFKVNEGEALVINSGVSHYYADMSEGGEVQVIKFHKDILMNVNFSKTNNNSISKLYENTFMCHPDTNVKRLILDVLNSEKNDFQECYITSKLLELTVYILMHEKVIFNIFSTLEETNSKFLTTILEYINENSSEDLTLQMLADYLGFSIHYCSRYIKKNTGMNFLEYLNAVRVVNAELMLLETDKNITEIAFETGFRSSQSFNRVFKTIKGKSPNEYRKNL